MAVSPIFERNMLALSSRDPALSVLIGSVSASRDIIITASKIGIPVPAQMINGMPIHFHSKIDPVREAEKYLSLFEGAGFIVFLGFGAGYHISGFLSRNEVSNVLIIDRDIRVFKAILEEIDVAPIIADPRVKILIDEDPGSVSEYLLKSYFPVIAGSLKTVSLGARINIEKEYFQNVIDEMKSVIDAIVDDYSVQAQFGRRWFTNTLRNLKRASESTLSIPPVRKAIVTGAGPSLELQLEEVRHLARNAFLIATDTSLPALLEAGIKPEAVISIDCQQISYHHFLSGIPRDIPLVLDLASPPLLANLTDSVIFFSSGHPFSRFISHHWRFFPAIDTTGGNVSHAALSFASSLGADEVYLAGIDFSYPGGKSYARGTYLYPLFNSIQNKMNPQEALFFAFIFNNSNLVKEKSGDTEICTTHTMLMYKKKMEQAISSLQCRISPLKGIGMQIAANKNSGHNRPIHKSLFSQGAQSNDWRQFIDEYAQNLALLPLPSETISKYLYSLSFDERDLWTTLLPLATWIKEYAGKKSLSGSELLSFTREYAIEQIKMLRSHR